MEGRLPITGVGGDWALHAGQRKIKLRKEDGRT